MIDLSPSEEQRQIVDGATTLLRENSPTSRSGAGAAGADIHGLLAEWGWFGVGLPEDLGGLGLGAAEEVLLAFEAGRFLAPPSVLATTLAARLAGEATRPALLSGARRAALVLEGDGAAFCFDRDEALDLVVFGETEVWLAPAAAFQGERLASIDEDVTVDRGALDPASRLAGEPRARAELVTAAVLAGVAQACCDRAVEYAKVREQFGQPIGAFQAIKHLCADLGLRAYLAEAQVKMAGAAFAEDAPDAAFQIAAAAVTAIGAARANASESIQAHGGIGFTAESGLHAYLKRAHVLGRLLGGLASQQAALLACPAPDRKGARP